MNKKNLLLSAALAGVVAAGVAISQAPEATAASGKEKCYGIAKAGQNDCGSSDGAHSCAGQATVDNSPHEWKYVGEGECAGMGGTTTPGSSDSDN